MASSNNYEEARKKRLEDNKKRFEDLGITRISRSLADAPQSLSKSPQRQMNLQPKRSIELSEIRRSTRARNQVVTYSEEVDIDRKSLRKRSKSNSSWTSYLARPINEVRTASYEERVQAIKCAEEIQNGLQSGYPSFVKSMVRSHVYSCFWLGLPSMFCKGHLPKKEVNMVLEDEDGAEYDAIYIGSRCGLSGGWRGFALDHKLDDGDALVFEQTEPARFKVYIFRASKNISEGNNSNTKDKEECHSHTRKTSKVKLDTDSGVQEKQTFYSRKAEKIAEDNDINHQKSKGKSKKVVKAIRRNDKNVLAKDVGNSTEDESASMKLEHKRGQKGTGSKKIEEAEDDAEASAVEIESNGFTQLPKRRVTSEKLFRKKVY